MIIDTHLKPFLGTTAASKISTSTINSYIESRLAHGRITSVFVRFTGSGLDLESRHLNLLLGGGFAVIGTDLARQARRFNPANSAADILQASRNAWAVCALQMMLGQKMGLTPAIFAYSMLYPYTDNYLDNPATSRELKLGFSARFGQRLAGEAVAPVNDHESGISAKLGAMSPSVPSRR